jgi:hypothetical protein
MMKPQKVEALRTTAEVCNAGLVGMQPQPDRGQRDLGQRSGQFGTFSGRTHDNKVVGVTDQHPCSLSVALEGLIEDVQRDVGEQR